MSRRQLPPLLCLAALLAGCGGGGNGGGSVITPVASAPTPTPTTPAPTAACSLRDRQTWAAAQLREWYLFPETLPASLDPSPYASVDSYIDALTATARSQRKDRFFTYVTSIAEEDAFYSSGSSAGFGFRLATNSATRRVFISEAFEGAPALAAGIDRGTELLAIGSSEATLRPVSDIIAQGGSGAVSEALGPSNPGVSRAIRLRDPGGGAERVVTIAKADYELTPVSSRYGARVLDDGGRRVGYVNLRTFISTADPALRQAFATFRAQGVTDVVVDLRYNGGGLVSIGQLFADLLGRDRAAGEVQGYTSFRPEKSAQSTTRLFRNQGESIAPMRIAFIGTGATASASESLINTFLPYLGNRIALIGTNTFGKPVGQIALDRSACDDRLRVVAFATQNSARQGDYYDGLATKVQASCSASDDTSRPLGDPQEASTRAALDFLAGRSCTAISAAQFQRSERDKPLELLTPERPTAAQREVPGLF